MPVDKDIYHDADAVIKTREEIVDLICDYIDIEQSKGVVLHSITRHILGLYQGCRGAKAWRRHLSEHGHREGADSSVVRAAMAKISQLQVSNAQVSNGQGDRPSDDYSLESNAS